MQDLSKVINIDPAKENITAEVDIFCRMKDDLSNSPISYNTKDQNMKLTYQDFKCDFFRYEGSAPGTCPIAPSSSDAILTVHMRYSINL